MKKLYSLFFAAFAFAMSYAQQMNISINGTVVTFSVNIPGPDWGSTPVYLYAYTETGDTVPAMPGNTEILGSWPGTMLTGTGTYTATVDLATKFSAGTTINNIKFIYNNNAGNQNPPSFSPGFSTTDTAHATGWSAVSIATLGVLDLGNLKGKTFVSEGQLYTAKTGMLNITVYDFSGKVVRTLNMKANGNPVDLEISQRGSYIVKVTNGNETEAVKFIR